MTDPLAFVARQIELLRPGGVVVLSDHTSGPAPDRAALHEAIERARDRTHTRNLTPGALVDLLARAGTVEIRLIEEEFTLDFDEWFDRGTPAASKASVREQILSAPPIRGFRPTLLDDGAVQIDCFRAIVRGVKLA